MGRFGLYVESIEALYAEFAAGAEVPDFRIVFRVERRGSWQATDRDIDLKFEALRRKYCQVVIDLLTLV